MNKRIDGLDILRCMAILFVLISHGNIFLPLSISKKINFFMLDGVNIFFVLSGFLIGGILIKQFSDTKQNGWNTLARFWKRRWYRTIPTYLLVLTCLVTFHYTSGDNLNGMDYLPFFFFSQNLITGPELNFFPESWSLSIEEWFYIILPILVMVSTKILRNNIKKSVSATVVFILFISLAIRTGKYFAYREFSVEEWDLFFRKPVICRLDSLALGVLGAYINYYYPSLFSGKSKIKLVLGILILIATHNKFLKFERNFPFYFSAMFLLFNSLGILLILPYFYNLQKVHGRVMSVVRHISKTSYSIYLIHYSIIVNTLINIFGKETYPHKTFVLQYIIYFSATFISASLLHKFFEMPATNLRDKPVFSFLKRGKAAVEL